MNQKGQKRIESEEGRREIMKIFFKSPISLSNKSRILRGLKKEYTLLPFLHEFNVFINFGKYNIYYYIFKKDNSIIIQRTDFGTHQHSNIIFNGKNNIYINIQTKNDFFPKKEIIKLNNEENYFLNFFKYELKYYNEEKHKKIVNNVNKVLIKTFDFVFFNTFDYENIIKILDIFYYYNDYEISEQQIVKIFLENITCFAWAFSSSISIDTFCYKLDKQYKINNMNLLKAIKNKNKNFVNFYLNYLYDLLCYFDENNMEFSQTILALIAEFNYARKNYKCDFNPAHIHNLKVAHNEISIKRKKYRESEKDFIVNYLNIKEYEEYIKIYNNLENREE